MHERYATVGRGGDGGLLSLLLVVSLIVVTDTTVERDICFIS